MQHARRSATVVHLVALRRLSLSPFQLQSQCTDDAGRYATTRRLDAARSALGVAHATFPKGSRAAHVRTRWKLKLWTAFGAGASLGSAESTIYSRAKTLHATTEGRNGSSRHRAFPTSREDYLPCAGTITPDSDSRCVSATQENAALVAC